MIKQLHAGGHRDRLDRAHRARARPGRSGGSSAWTIGQRDRRRRAAGGDARRARRRRLPRRRRRVSLLEIEHLELRHGLLEAVRDFSLSIAEGETVALVGANGAGKTTLLRAIAGAHRPSAGTITFDGGDITRSARPPSACGWASRSCPRGGGCSRRLTVEENLLVAAQRSRPGRWTVETRARGVPDARASAPSARGDALRRRAAGDRDRPRADLQSAPAAARRGLARARAAGRRRRLQLARDA